VLNGVNYYTQNLIRGGKMKHKMTWYLHESKGAFLEQISGEELDEQLSDQAREELNYAFYEVGLNIEVDTETGRIKILEVIDNNRLSIRVNKIKEL
jgi:hypothetical protein